MAKHKVTKPNFAEHLLMNFATSRDQLRQNRHVHLQTLAQELAQVKADIGQPRLRSLKAVQRRANARFTSLFNW
jgi:hypothetical protein